MVTAIFAGSFDPPTYGHLNVIERAHTLFDSVHVVIAVNKAKSYLFNEVEREAMLKSLIKPWKNVSVHLCSSLIVEYAKANGASVLIRGIRNVSDFSYEFDLALMNKTLDSSIETVFIPTDPKYVVLKSSSIKELASFGADVSNMVPPIVSEKLKEKMKEKIIPTK